MGSGPDDAEVDPEALVAEVEKYLAIATPDGVVKAGRSCRVGCACRSVSGTGHLADRRSDLKSATGPRCVSLSGLTIELMLVI